MGSTDDVPSSNDRQAATMLIGAFGSCIGTFVGYAFKDALFGPESPMVLALVGMLTGMRVGYVQRKESENKRGFGVVVFIVLVAMQKLLTHKAVNHIS